MKLLLVEPSILLRERLVAMLASIYFVEIAEASTVDDACRLKQVILPEVVVMDAQLPDEISIEALGRVKTECPLVCLIVITPYAEEPYRKRWLQAGADHCFDLSSELDQFMEIVKQHSRARPCLMP